jgi:hypothetical protein
MRWFQPKHPFFDFHIFLSGHSIIFLLSKLTLSGQSWAKRCFPPPPRPSRVRYDHLLIAKTNESSIHHNVPNLQATGAWLSVIKLCMSCFFKARYLTFKFFLIVKLCTKVCLCHVGLSKFECVWPPTSYKLLLKYFHHALRDISCWLSDFLRDFLLQWLLPSLKVVLARFTGHLPCPFW